MRFSLVSLRFSFVSLRFSSGEVSSGFDEFSLVELMSSLVEVWFRVVTAHCRVSHGMTGFHIMTVFPCIFFFLLFNREFIFSRYLCCAHPLSVTHTGVHTSVCHARAGKGAAGLHGIGLFCHMNRSLLPYA